jgi:glycerophosphoryl diester phosphodiesterase
MNTFTNLFVKNDINQRRTKDHHGIIIDAHRGGQKGVEPDNTLRAFEKAIEMGVQMIELDIWITKDDKLVIMHGGNNGELPEKDIKFLSLAGPGEKAGEPEYIFDYTYAEIREHHKQTNYFLNSS